MGERDRRHGSTVESGRGLGIEKYGREVWESEESEVGEGHGIALSLQIWTA